MSCMISQVPTVNLFGTKQWFGDERPILFFIIIKSLVTRAHGHGKVIAQQTRDCTMFTAKKYSESI